MEKYNISYFIGKNYSFALIKNNKLIYKSKSQGLKPLVFCLKKYSAKGRVAAGEKKEMRGAIVYDKVIGLAAAMLLVFGGVKEIWTPTISRPAKNYLRKYKVKIIYKKEVNNIMNKDGNDLCGMEKLAKEKGLKRLREFWKI